MNDSIVIDLDRVKYLTELLTSHEISYLELEELEELQKHWLLNSEITDSTRISEVKRSYT